MNLAQAPLRNRLLKLQRSTAMRGFTLMELMIVVIVIAVLAAIAIPQYGSYITRAKRAEAKRALSEAAQFLERTYTVSGCYSRSDAAACPTQSGTAVTLPTVLQKAPAEGKQSYAISLQFTSSGQAFTLTATPCASASCTGSYDNFSDPGCGNYGLDNTGSKTATGTLGVAYCWQR